MVDGFVVFNNLYKLFVCLGVDCLNWIVFVCVVLCIVVVWYDCGIGLELVLLFGYGMYVELVIVGNLFVVVLVWFVVFWCV